MGKKQRGEKEIKWVPLEPDEWRLCEEFLAKSGLILTGACQSSDKKETWLKWKPGPEKQIERDREREARLHTQSEARRKQICNEGGSGMADKDRERSQHQDRPGNRDHRGDAGDQCDPVAERQRELQFG